MGRVASVPFIVLLMLLAACAGNVRAPQIPENSQLRPAQAMVQKAEAAGAAQLAPAALREAHRRLGLAQGLLYNAATQHRDISAAEKRRIDRLVEEATVDARLALALTQQEAVERKRAAFQGAVEGNEEAQ